MTKKTCFVIMPIGAHSYGEFKFSARDLKERYDDLIREALLKADPELEVTRADEVSLPGTITTDILTQIMHSDFVVADVSFPNANVFYELGVRHACRPATIIIRDANSPEPPFDIAYQRHIVYENTATGLKKLEAAFRNYFKQLRISPGRPDNHFLELAKLTKYQFPHYGDTEQTRSIFIKGEDQVIAALIEGVKRAKKHIRTSRYFPQPINKRHNDYIAALSKALEDDQLRDHLSRVIACNNAEKLDDIRECIQLFAGKKATLYLTRSGHTFDMVIIDDQEAFLHFYGRDSVVAASLHIRDPEVAQRLIKVYDYLKSGSLVNVHAIKCSHLETPNDIHTAIQGAENFFSPELQIGQELK